MYSTQNNNNSQASQNRLPPGWYTMKAKTKERVGLDGNSNRGILIHNQQTGEQQWITIPAANEVCRLNFGSKVYYHGHNARPSLTFRPEQANDPTFDNGGVQQTPPPIDNSQARADFYNRVSQSPQSVYDSIEQGMYAQPSQSEIDYNQQMYSSNSYQQPVSQNGTSSSSSNTVDDRLIEQLGVLYSNCMNMAMSLNPQLDADNQTKIAISMAITYNRIKADSPF